MKEANNLFFKSTLQRFTKQFRMLLCENSDVLNFSSFDSLNLTQNEHVRECGINYMTKWGTGDLPSRPIDELTKLKRNIEDAFASMTIFETATLLEMQQIIPSQIVFQLASPKSLILKQNSFAHFPLKPALMRTFDIADESTIKTLLSSVDPLKYDMTILLIESISSRTGKKADLKQIAALSKELGCLLVVDDSNSFSSMGRYGMGLAASVPGIDIVFGSFSKAFGTYASYVLASKPLKDFILRTSSIAASATPISPLILGFIKASLDILPNLESKRELLTKRAKLFRDLFIKTGISPCSSDSHIISLSFDNLLELKHFNFHLSENQCISNIYRMQDDHRKKQTCRFVINADHSSCDLKRLSSILKSLRSAPYCEAL